MERKVLITALLSALLLFGLSGCSLDEAGAADPGSSSPAGTPSTTLGPTTVARGPLFLYSGLSGVFLDGNGELLVVLRGSASAGDEWSYTVEPEGMLRQTTSAYASDTPSASGEVVGRGFYYWVFEGVGEGDALVTFTYTDSGSEGRGVGPEAYWVSVGADGKVSFFKRLVPKSSRPSGPMGGMVR